MFRILSLVRMICRPPLPKGCSDQLLLHSPKPANPLRLNRRASTVYPQYRDRQSQFTYLTYFQSLGLENWLFFSKNEWFGTLVPLRGCRWEHCWAHPRDGERNPPARALGSQKSSPRTELVCRLKSGACLENLLTDPGGELIRDHARGQRCDRASHDSIIAGRHFGYTLLGYSSDDRRRTDSALS